MNIIAIQSAPPPWSAAPRRIVALAHNRLTGISDQTQTRVHAMESGTAALEQAVRQSRQDDRQAAADKVAMAHEYLKLLALMSSPDDPAAAREAARMARQIRGATLAYQSIAKDTPGASAGMTALAIDGKKALALARQIIERHLRRKRQTAPADNEMRQAIDDALDGLQGQQQLQVISLSA